MDRTLTVQLILGDVCQEYEMLILIHYNEVPTLTFDKLNMTRQEFATEFNCEKTKMTGLPGGGTISIIGWTDLTTVKCEGPTDEREDRIEQYDALHRHMIKTSHVVMAGSSKHKNAGMSSSYKW